MKPIYDEELEIVGKIDGTLQVQMRWRDKAWEQDLPRGFDRWTLTEQKAHLKDRVIPVLRLKLLEAQKEALMDPATAGDDCVVRIQYDDRDINLMTRAEEKRQRKSKLIC